MAKCYNCGTQISADDKLRLCDRCKSILLPFIKLTDASTSSAVARLISNERNLRARGVTDNGMDYLMRICEAHDREKVAEKARREAQKAPKQPPQPQQTAPQPVPEEEYLEIDLPMSAPLSVHRKPYGGFLTLSAVILFLCGTGFLAWAVLQWITAQTADIPSILAAVGSFAAGSVCFPLKKLIHDVEEIKKQFR
ncbi:MAG: hypothetical protein IJF78_09410 [Clostridia bacterium]|nr:hypothetical protein [Clostridia bacterium]